MVVKDQKVTHDINKIMIYRPCFKTTAFTTYDEELFKKICSVTWSVLRSKTGKEYISSSKYGSLHQLVIKNFYGEDVLVEAYENNLVIDHLDNNGYDCSYENLALIPRKQNCAKGLTYDIERREAINKFVIDISKDMDSKEFQISLAFNQPFYLTRNGEEIYIQNLYLRYGIDFKTAFIDAQSILNDLDSSDSVNFKNLRYSDMCYVKAKQIKYTPDILDKPLIVKDNEIYFVQGSPKVKIIKTTHNKEIHKN